MPSQVRAQLLLAEAMFFPETTDVLGNGGLKVYPPARFDLLVPVHISNLTHRQDVAT
jgi:hypothetical protein